MKTIYVMKGLPASGKSTWAKATVGQNPGAYKIINKDSLRAMLDAGKHTGAMEGFVIKARNLLLRAALDDGKHVVVDDTNLNPIHERAIRDIAKEYAGQVRVEVVDFTHISPQECIERDLKRCPSVGSKVIWDMYNKWLRTAPVVRETDPTLPTAIMVDIDGTLAWKGDRDVYDASKAYLDTLNPAIAAIVRSVSPHVTRVIMSGRQEVHRDVTEEWLRANDIPFNEIHMRATGDQRKDSIVKRELYETHIEGKYNVLFVLDDRNQVVDMWRSLGLQCLQVAEGNY
jgi:predicted kinase